MRFNQLVWIITGMLMIACNKEEPEIPVDTVPELSNGLLIMNEGLFQQNNSRLSFIDLETQSVQNQFFESKVGRPLGDTGNDIAQYGGKIYCVVNVSNTIEVLNAANGKSIQQISMIDNGVSKQPRAIAFSNGKAFVSCFDGYVDVIDTHSLELIQRVEVGRNPDQILAAEGKIFVSNSGGLDFPNVDTTVSVIDPISYVEQKIVVGLNPGKLVDMGEGEVFVLIRGNDAGQNSSVLKTLNANTNEMIGTFSFDLLNFCRFGDDALIVRQNSNGDVEVVKMNVSTGLLDSDVFMSTADVVTLYGIDFIPELQKIIVFDAQEYVNTGKVLLYSSSGNFESSYSVTLNPSSYVWFK